MINLLSLILVSATAYNQPFEISTAATLAFNFQDQVQPAEEVAQESPLTEPWGATGSWRWGIQLGYAEEFTDSKNTFGIVGVEFEYFVEEQLSLNLGFNYFDVEQIGTDATGFNATLLLRWYFLDHQTWSMFLEAGAGFMSADNDIPLGGSESNFTPQAGVGFSFDLNQSSRLLVGVRWHHISNANLYDNNPGRDSLMLWTGISFPF